MSAPRNHGVRRLLDDLAVAVTQQIPLVILRRHPPTEMGGEQLAEDAVENRLVVGKRSVEVEDDSRALGLDPLLDDGSDLVGDRRRWHRNTLVSTAMGGSDAPHHNSDLDRLLDQLPALAGRPRRLDEAAGRTDQPQRQSDRPTGSTWFARRSRRGDAGDRPGQRVLQQQGGRTSRRGRARDRLPPGSRHSPGRFSGRVHP